MNFYPDGKIKFFDEDGGSVINISEDLVFIKKPHEIDLKKLLQQFECRLVSELRILMRMEYGEAAARYGLLGLNANLLESRRQTPVGFLCQANRTKLAIIKERSAVRALVSLGMISSVTARGKSRERFPHNEGAVSDFLLALSPSRQADVLDELLAGELDEVLACGQRDNIGLARLRQLVQWTQSKVDCLTALVAALEEQISTPDRGKEAFHGKGSGRCFAFMWFSQYLASQGVCLFPLRYYSRMLAFYPDHFRPLLPLMSVPTHSRDIADEIIGSAIGKTSLKPTVSVFAIAALSSTMWSRRRFCSAPLGFMKETLGTADACRSASINHVYKLLARKFSISIRERGEARLLSGRVRDKSVEAFRWVSKPDTRNTSRISVLTGFEVTEKNIPEHTKSLCLEMRELLETFTVQNMAPVEAALSLFLAYTLLLEEADAPRRLQDIRLQNHVRSAGPHLTFWRFLEERCPPSNARSSAISKMREVWRAAAVRDGFYEELTCPFDPLSDKVADLARVPRRNGRALEQAVINLLVELNREGDYAFARRDERNHFVLQNRSGAYERVFWPAAAIIVEVTLLTGLRLKSARWLDSGEGDEYWFDPINQVASPNPLKCKINGRQEFFIRPIQLDDAGRTMVNGMYVNVAKSGPYEFPYLPDELSVAISRMRDLQLEYNPIGGPVRAIDSKDRRASTNLLLFPLVFPVMRTPDPLAGTISEASVRQYYRNFIQYAQPIITERLGRDYGLADLDEKRVLTTLHDHRRSLVTNNNEVAVPLEVLAEALGHKSIGMTGIYNHIRPHRIYAKMQEASAAHSRALLEQVAQNDPDAVNQMAKQFAAVSGSKSEAASRMEQIASGTVPAQIDLFMHGICISGTCETGASPEKGSRKGVWRPRACGGCIYRGSGWAHRAGIVTRIRMLSLEIRREAKRLEDLNRKIEDLEASGVRQSSLRGTSRSMDYYYRCLTNELRLEKEWLRKVDAAAQAAKLADRPPTSIVLSGKGFEIQASEVLPSEFHIFELLHSVLKDLTLMPAGILELPPGSLAEHEAHVRQILRPSKQEDVFLRIPESQKLDALVALGDLLLDSFGEPSELQRLIEDSASDLPHEDVVRIAASFRHKMEGSSTVRRIANS